MDSVLDNPLRIRDVDRSDMLVDLTKTPEYCMDAVERALAVKVPETVAPKNVFVVGMGGSAIGGEILRDWLRDELPVSIEVCRDYILPAYVDKNSLVFVNSYSGNTEETLSAFLEAKQRQCTIVAVTSGGLLERFCSKLDVPCVKVPSGLQPRAAIPYLFFPLPVLMSKMGLISDIDKELEETVQVLKSLTEANAPDVPTEKNIAKQVAQKLHGTIPVVYGFRQYGSVAQRLKAQFNENSKVPSKAEVFPELNHNETVGYMAPEMLVKQLSVLLIRDKEEPAEIRNRIEATKSLVFSRAGKTLELWAEGKGKLAKMFSVICKGDYTSVYLAVLQGVDPSPVKIIDRVKAELAKRNRMKERFEVELEKLE